MPQSRIFTSIAELNGLNRIFIVMLASVLLVSSASIGAAQESSPEPGAIVESTPDAIATPTTLSTPDAAATPEAAVSNELGTVLMTYDFESLPQAPMTVRLLRITLEPGASVPMHTHPGPEMDLVESGTLTAEIDGTAIISTGGETSEVSDTQSLSTDSWILYPEGTGMSLINEGSENVELMSTVILAVGGDNQQTITYAEGEPTQADFEGVSFTVLGDGLIQQFPSGPATVTVDQLDVAAGQTVPGFTGSALLSKDSGDLAFEAGEGSVQVTRTATPQLQPNAIPEQQFTLADNDAAFFPAGYETIERPEADTELVLMRLLIEPSESLANAPAIVSTIQPGDASETADVGEQDVEGFGIGAIVELNEDGVRVRQEATTDSNIVDGFTAGTQFELVDGPVEGESFTWYAVQGVGDLSDVEGWLVTDFMDIVEPAPADGQAASSDGSAGSEDTPTEGDATPAAATTEAAQPAVDLAVGDLVVTSDDNVRIRFEPDTGTDIVIALATGTELEVIGGPEENQDFTWYEVQVVDSDTTGWTVAEFLAPADSSEEDTEG